MQPDVAPARSAVALRLAGIVLLLVAWFPAALLVFVLRSLWGGVLVGLPAACCFALAYRRSGASGNLVGVGLALATPLVWFVIVIAMLSGADMS